MALISRLLKKNATRLAVRMTGTRPWEFNHQELISPFLLKKMEEAKPHHDQGNIYPHCSEYDSICRQYVKSPIEETKTVGMRRHYESEVHHEFDGAELKGVERLYQKTVLLEPTTYCYANCRFCLRGMYPELTLNKQQIEHATRYFGSDECKDLNEILITGGDPLSSPALLEATLDGLALNAPNIRVVRIGTRIFAQNPENAMKPQLVRALRKQRNHRMEIGFQVCHPSELDWPETRDALTLMKELGIKLYEQNPMIKGVNDNLDLLKMTYNKLRELDVEAHYLFHAIPTKGTTHLRTSLDRFLEIGHELSSCGSISGRAKPKLAILSDIGKIVLYEGCILKREGTKALIRSGYSLKGRLAFNRSWQIPDSVEVTEDGKMNVWYDCGE